MDNQLELYILKHSDKSIRALSKETGICRNIISKLLKSNGINKNTRLTDMEKEFILNNYKLEYKELSKVLNKPLTTIKSFLNRNGYYKRVEFSPNLDEFIYNFNKHNMLEMCKLYSVDKATLLKYIDLNNIKRKRFLMNERTIAKKEYRELMKPNYDYFENINTPQKAYYLGLIASDGSVSDRSVGYKNSENTIQITLKSNDGYILENLHREINTHRVCSKVKSNGTTTFQISSNKMSKDLMKYGIKFRKTWDMDIKNIPRDFIPSFLLGYFDGDGSISKHKYKKTINTTNVNISGTESSVNSIKLLLDELHLKYSIIQDKRIEKYKGSFYTIHFKNTTEKYCFLKTIYSQNCVSLDRKKDLALELMSLVESNSTNRSENVKAINNYLNMPFMVETP